MDMPPVEIQKEVEQPHLELFYFPQCPYCQMVLSTLSKSDLKIELKNIRQDGEALAELVRIGGKKQVPCLFIDGVPMYESRDIINYLETLR